MAGRRTIKIKLNNFFDGVNANLEHSAMPISTAVKCYNFDYKDGALKTGLGCDAMTVLNGRFGIAGEPRFVSLHHPIFFKPCACYHYKFYDPEKNFEKAHKLVLIGKNKQIYQIDIPCLTDGVFPNYYTTLQVEAMPKNVLNYRLNNSDVLIMCFENECMHVYDASKPEEERLVAIENAPKMISMCIHYERLFAIVSGQRNAIWFSKELDPTMWNVSLDGAGFIEMIDERGELTKVVSFNNYVYIFREYGIARLTGFADQAQFSVSQLFTSSGRIYEDTVTICGDRILFLAEDGLYVFDGSSTRKITTNIEKLFVKEKNKHAKAIYYNGKYYLACFLNFEDEVDFGCEKPAQFPMETVLPTNNSLIEIDLKQSRLTIFRGWDIGFLNTINETDYSQLIFCSNHYFDTYAWEIKENHPLDCNQPMQRLWQSPKTDFGYSGKTKILKEFSFLCKCFTRFTINTDSEMRVFNLSAGNEKQTVKCAVKGKVFDFEFLVNSRDYAHIEGPEFIVDVLT